MVRRSFIMAAMAMLVVWGAQAVAQDPGPGTHEGTVVKAGERLPLEAHCVLVLSEHGTPEVEPDLSPAASVAAQTA